MDSSQNVAHDATERKPWDQQEGEPDLWYGRFKVYLGLGPLRTFHATYCQVTKARSSKSTDCTPNRWYLHARRWVWRERAHAWDAYQRDLLALSERNTRLALRHRRVNTMEDALETICAALATADIGNADQETAREWFPQLRVFLRDMLVAERQEFERLDYEREDPNNTLVITADELAAAQRELEMRQQANVQRALAEAPVRAAHEKRWKYSPPRSFLVCTGADSELLLDLAALRAVRAATGLQFTRLINATRRKFYLAMRRARGLGHPVEYIHMALHASAAGLEFADGPVDGNWLSERLEGVRVLLLASCESDSIGDWLSVVPYVISVSEDIAHEDAAALAQHFWHGIGSGKEPGEALDDALAHCPPAVGEYVVRHW